MCVTAYQLRDDLEFRRKITKKYIKFQPEAD